LQGGKAKYAATVVQQNPLHGAVAEVADPVEKENRRINLCIQSF